MDLIWLDFIKNHPLYSKPHMMDKFREIHEADLGEKNETFRKNFHYLIEKKELVPIAASRLFRFNEGFLIAFFNGYAPKGETLERVAWMFEVSEDDLLHKELFNEATI